MHTTALTDWLGWWCAEDGLTMRQTTTCDVRGPEVCQHAQARSASPQQSMYQGKRIFATHRISRSEDGSRSASALFSGSQQASGKAAGKKGSQ